MELWIRSQSREDLLKAKCLGVYNERIYANGYEDNGYCIGIYKTKERALEVLDEIQNIFSLDIKNKGYDECDLLLKARLLPTVYEMPEE